VFNFSNSLYFDGNYVFANFFVYKVYLGEIPSEYTVKNRFFSFSAFSKGVSDLERK
jgi:hypothetical protein